MFNWLVRMVRSSFVEGVRQGLADIAPDAPVQTVEELGRLVATAPALPAKEDDEQPKTTRKK